MPRKRRDAGLELYPPGALVKGSDSWYIRGTYLGQRVFRSAKTGQRKAADALRRRIEREIEEGHQPRRRALPTFSDAALGYLKACPDSQVPYVKRLIEHFKATPLADIDQRAIDVCAEALFPSASNSTINRNCIGPLAAVLHHGAEQGLCAWMRVKRRREPKGRTQFLDAAQAARFLEACPTARCRALAILLLVTGMRMGEAIKLRWEDVDLSRRHATLHDTKNGETYGVHLPEVAFEAIASLPGEREGRVFGYYTRWQLYQEWDAAREAAELPWFSPHLCRHTFATWLRQAGKDLRFLMEAGRWKDGKSVFRYAHVSVDDEVKSALDRLPIGEHRVKTRRRKV